MSNNSSIIKSKKKRGRPPLPPEEKRRRQTARKEAAQKKRKQRLEKESAKRETADEIIAKTNGFMKNGLSPQVLEAVSEIPKPPISNYKSLKSSDMDVNAEVSDTFQTQDQMVVKKITDLEHETNLLKIRQDTVEKKCNEVVRKQKDLIQKNILDENVLFEQELCLAQLDFEETEYTADNQLPTWVRTAVSKIIRKPDELIVVQKISRANYRIQNRSQELNKLDTHISNLTTAVIYYKSVTESLDTMVQSLRDLRTRLGDEFRKLRHELKQKQLKFDREKIMKTLGENINDLNRITSESTQQIQAKVKQDLQTLNNYQNQSLKSTSNLGEDSPFFVDEN